MSTIIVITEKDRLVLATDSRFCLHDFTGIATDAAQKVFEIGPETFIATSGRKWACDFQTERARELASEVLGGPIDIRALGETLKRESLPCLMRLLERLRMEADETTKQHVSGAALLHGCVLAGRMASGQWGYVLQTYQVRAGKIECDVDSYFGDVRKIAFTAAVPVDFSQDYTIWTDPPVSVVQRLLAQMRRLTPLTGGPDQIVCLDGSGARWISRPPRAAVPLVGDLTAATIAVAVSMTAPTLTITAGSTTINLDAANLFKVSKTGFTQQIGTGLSGGFGAVDGMLITGSGSPAPQVAVDMQGMHVGSTSGAGSFYSFLSQGALLVSNPGAGTSAQLDYGGLVVNGVNSIRARYGTTPTTLADVIVLLQHHGLCV